MPFMYIFFFPIISSKYSLSHIIHSLINTSCMSRACMNKLYLIKGVLLLRKIPLTGITTENDKSWVDWQIRHMCLKLPKKYFRVVNFKTQKYLSGLVIYQFLSNSLSRHVSMSLELHESLSIHETPCRLNLYWSVYS